MIKTSTNYSYKRLVIHNFISKTNINFSSLDKKYKIAIVVYTLKMGGLERVVSNQTFMFSELGFEVELFVLENEIDFPYKGKLHVYDFKQQDDFFSKFKKYLKVKNDIQNGNFDFVLDHRYRLNGFMERFWLHFIYKNQKLLYYIHSGDIASYINSKLASASNIQFISVSEGIETKVRNYFPKINIQTIYNHIEVSCKATDFAEINENYILAAGRMDQSNVKQFDVLIDCYAKSELPKNQIKLLILGSGIRMEVLKKQVLDLNLQDLVVFKGFESHVYSYYKNAKYLVLSSKFEGLGMVLIESLLCETPVISFDCEFGPNEIIKHKSNGLLVENQNVNQLIEAMNLLALDQNLYEFCKTNAFSSVQKFRKKEISENWLNYFNDKH